MKNKSVNIQRLRGSCEGPGESCLRSMVKAIKKNPSPFPFALRQDTIVTQMSRGTEVALIMVELGYSRRFSSMVAPFLEVMNRYPFPYVERWGRLLSAPPPPRLPPSVHSSASRQKSEISQEEESPGFCQ